MNCIIVDDEYPAREELKYFIKNFSNLKILEEFDDSVKALQFVEKHSPDIVFLDINMPNLDGMALGKIVNNFTKSPLIVFISAHMEFAVEAFEIKAFDYILKPYSEERIISTLKNLEKCTDVNCKSDKITVWKNDKIIVLDISRICYCEAHERETMLYADDEKYIINASISEVLNRLPGNIFFRTHRSYIVNLNKITEIIPWFNNTYRVILKNCESEIPVSRNHINEFKHIMGI